MADELAIQIFVDDRKASATLEAFAKRAEAQTAKIGNINPTIAKEFSNNLSAVERRVLSIRQELTNVGNVTIGQRGLDGLGQAALRTKTHITDIYTRLQQIEKEAATVREPAMLNKLQAEAAQLNNQLDRIETKMRRVAQGRSAVVDRASVGVGQAAQVAGAASAFLPAEVAIAADMATALTGVVSVAALAAAGTVAAVGAGIIYWSKKVREEAELRLKIEERIQKAINDQILLRKNALAEVARSRAETEANRQFTESLTGPLFQLDSAALARRRQTIEQLQQLTPDPANIERYEKQINEIKGLEDKARQQRVDADQSAFEQNWNNYLQRQEAEREAEKARLANIEEAKKKVDELGKSYLAAFAGIGVGNENPFVRLYTEGEEALKSFREQTQGLSRDLVSQGELLIKQQTDLARFRARADAAFEGLDLRQQARNFRNPAQQAESQEQYLKRIEDGLNRAYNSGFFGLRRSPDEGQLQLTPEMARQAYATYLAGAGMNLPGLTDASRTTVGLAGIEAAQQRAAETRTASERLDEQLKLAEQLRRQAATEQKRAEIDARIVGLSRGIDPTTATPTQREAIATALENMAVRTERREQDEEAVKKDLLATNAQIRDYLEFLKTKAEEGGTQKLDITLQDATGQLQRASSPTPDTVSITGF